PQYTVQYYLENLPETQAEIDSLTDEQNFAFYQLGLIYAEKLEEDELARQRFESLLEVEDDEELIKPAQYQLYKIYKRLGDEAQAHKYKTDILTNYPDSRYARIIENPQAYQKDKRNPEKVYSNLYRKYESGDYKTVLRELEKEILNLGDDEIVAKMELLKAFVKGRLEGVKAYEKALRHVALTYPQRLEGKKAQELLNTSVPHIKGKDIIHEPWVKQKLIYRFSAADLDIAEK